MTEEEVRAVVKATLRELGYHAPVKENYSAILRELDTRLYRYFEGAEDNELKLIFKILHSEPYLNIIPLHYQHKKTIDQIAEYMGKDARTIKRNKKKLIVKMYGLLKE